MRLFIFLVLLSVYGCSSSSQLIKSDQEYIVKQNKIKDSLAFELCQIYGLDQGIRDYSINFDNRQKVTLAIDSLNFDKVVAFVTDNGYPTRKLLGTENFDRECVALAFTAVLLHNPTRLVKEKKYFDLFLNEVKKNNLEASYFAMILDKHYWAYSKNTETRRVFYGSQFGKPCIQTKDATNSARIEIGLKALDDDGFVDCGEEELDMPKERI